MRKTIILFLFAVFTIKAQNDTSLHYSTMGMSFPPVADFEQRAFCKTHLDYLGVKKIRFAENWSLRELTPGNFDWRPLDERINFALTNNYEIMLTIQSIGPDWACTEAQNERSCAFKDTVAFKNYIDLLVQRYSGKIKIIQFGNEWQSDYWFAGNAEQFIAANNVLYNSVKKYSPETRVALGGFSSMSMRFMAGCNGLVDSFYDDSGKFYNKSDILNLCQSDGIKNGKKRIDSVLNIAKYDIIDIHFYDDVEQWDEYYDNFTNTISAPIIVSEFGGPNINYEQYSDSYQIDRLYKYIKKLDSLQIPEIYYFKLVEGTDNSAYAESGLIDDTTLIEKPTYYLFKQFLDNTTGISEPVGFEIFLFPNPASEYIEINPPLIPPFSKGDAEGRGISEIKIYNNYDECVISDVLHLGDVGHLKRIDISHLPVGLYFIQIGNYSEKFMVVR